MSWKKVFEKGQELVLSTCSTNATPNVNVVISLGFHNDKLLIADAQMNKTIKNLKDNNKICIFAKKDGLYYRISGEVEIFNSGELYDLCVANDKEYPAKNAILVSVKEVFDLDKVERVV